MKSLLDSLDYDLPHFSPFLQQLPALADAFDAVKMKHLLQETLFNPANAIYTIIDCRPGKAMYLADHGCNMQFDLKILNNITNELIHTLVNARLFQNLADCKAYLRKVLIPLSFGMSGRSETEPFAKPVAVIEPLKMAIAVFPLDGMLPSLVSATYSKRMVIVFNRTLPAALAGEFLVQDVHLDLAHYGRYQRCVLRYRIDGEPVELHTPDHQVIYGKVDGDQQGGLTVQVINQLREKLRAPNLPYAFRVPAAYGYLPEMNLFLMEALPGEPVIDRLIKEGKENITIRQDGNFTIDEAMVVCARMLLTLHNSKITLGQYVSLETRATSVKKEIWTLQKVFPELGSQLDNWMDEILDYAQNTDPLPMGFSHGDYTYTQLIFDGSQGGLVDFDTVCQAEPALDLGQFIAYLRLAILKAHPSLGAADPDHLCNIFLDAYIAGARDWVPDEQQLRARVAIYELISLIRLIVHSWLKLKGSRLRLVLSLFEERYACLQQIS